MNSTYQQYLGPHFANHIWDRVSGWVGWETTWKYTRGKDTEGTIYEYIPQKRQKKLEFDAGTFFIIKYNSTVIKRSFSHSFQYLYTTYNRYNVLNF